MGISTHVLDIARGRPAAGIPATLDSQRSDGTWERAGEGVTNDDGRIKPLLPESLPLVAGTYRIRFDVDTYLVKFHRKAFFPSVTLEFRVENPAEHFHVPLLLSPYGFSTYRGS